MIKTDDIRVYQAITAIQMYCKSNYMTEELENGRMGCNKAVSYTHLDVYKRQVLSDYDHFI